MSPFDLVIKYWLALVAGIVAGVLPRGDFPARRRLALGLITALTVVSVQWLWPVEAAAGQDTEEWPHLLNLLIGLPIVGGVALLFIPRQMLSLIRGFTLAVLGVGFVASLALLTVPMTAGWHFQYIKDWIPSVGIRWHVAVDGISLWLILMTTFMAPIAAYASFGSIKTQIKELAICLLLLQGAMLGAFVALDLFLFFVFWELMLVPMYVMIGIWGGAEKIKAALKLFIYTMAGSMLLLAGILYVVWAHQKLTGTWSFDYLALSRVALPWTAQVVCFFAFSIAFFIKVPMWPVHTWLPDAHVQAPTGGSVILAAVMLKLGTYAYLRFSMGLFPGPAWKYAANMAAVAILGGILYGALVAWKQTDAKRLVAYSSVAHLGFVMLGLFGATATGIQGAVLQMVNHGISTGALFLLVGVIYDRRHTRLIAEFGGIAKVMPIYAALFVVVTFSSIGVPGTNGFVGEFMVIIGTATSKALDRFAGIQTIGAAAGVILAAVYMLSMVQRVFFGPLTHPKNKALKDISPRESVALAPLVLMIFVIGLFPSIFLDRMKDSVAMASTQFKELSEQSIVYARDTAQLHPVEAFPPAFLKGAPGFDGASDEKEPEHPDDHDHGAHGAVPAKRDGALAERGGNR
ncbi:complex I subunit 4 family protein [Chondromyces crocatus]|uniref:NADH dehydrogenase n=1 Tax=Chondromyces crocatus TaxID=52 RepID=A0A0K1EGA1_CHOCO|nr:NADH-quinone oxidoreductase subunit M [Chondromyces crocatus]AKT39901.1 NADH dehydrogenase [Chondromyces crocatus]